MQKARTEWGTESVKLPDGRTIWYKTRKSTGFDAWLAKHFDVSDAEANRINRYNAIQYSAKRKIAAKQKQETRRTNGRGD